MEKSYSLKNIVSLLWRHVLLIIFITVIGGAAAFAFSKFVLPLKYSSHITMYVQSYTGIAESMNSADAYNSVSNSKQLVNTYMEVLKDDAVMNAVGEKLSAQFDENTIKANFDYEDNKIKPSSIRACLSIKTVQDTSAIKVTATTKNAKVAAAICNDLSAVAPEYVEKAVGVGSINTIDQAKVYEAPVAPNKTKNSIIGALAAFFLVCLVIIVIDFFDNTVKDTNVLAEQHKKAILGSIQKFGDDKKKKSQDEDDHIKLTDKGVPFNVVESYKSIRTNISFALSTVDKKIFAVSSANPGEGKSTTSANIAIAMAQGGNKVLLIDADMRKSVQHKIFGLKNKKGLSSAISKMNKLEECIQKDVMENLDVMTAGPVPPNPSELLASDNMSDILDQLSQEYSAILIDTPPVNIVTDAMELAKNVSGIALIVRYGSTTDDDVEQAISKIDFAQMNMLGFIMNEVSDKRSGYYSKYKYKYKNKYYYKKGYGYGYGYGGYYGSKPETNDDETAKEAKEDTAKSDSSKNDISAKDTAKNKDKKKG